MQAISLDQSEGHLVEIISKLSPGEEIALTRNGVPVATLRAAPSPSEPPHLGTLRESIVYIDPDFDAIPEGFEDYLP